MTKQELARKRNWFKYQLMGSSLINTNAKILTPDELILLKEIKHNLASLVLLFDESSRELGLNVPEHKCWCGRNRRGR